VVASLWDLDDAIIRDLLVDFHLRLQTEGDPLLALRQTQVAQLGQADPARAHPASWAGLVGVGGLDARAWARPASLDEHESR
jgi:CHAT domain-containing protein